MTGLGAITGWAALCLHGGGFFDGLLPDGVTQRPVAIASQGGSRRPRAGVVFKQGKLHDDEMTVIQGIRCTTPRRAIFDEMRAAEDVREAVVVMDMAAAARIMSIERMKTYVGSRGGWTGVEQVRRALELADEKSRSPQETRARLIWVLDAGLPKPLVNRPIFDRNQRLLGIADLLDPVAGFVLEYDGDDHRMARRHSSDVDREARFRRALLEVSRATSFDVREPPKLAARLQDAHGRALFLPVDERPWTLQIPESYELELPLDMELDLRGEPQ